MDDHPDIDADRADYWKDPDQRARDAVVTMERHLEESLRSIGPAKLLEIRANVARDPANGGLVEMIDRHLKRPGDH